MTTRSSKSVGEKALAAHRKREATDREKKKEKEDEVVKRNTRASESSFLF